MADAEIGFDLGHEGRIDDPCIEVQEEYRRQQKQRNDAATEILRMIGRQALVWIFNVVCFQKKMW